MAFLTDNAVRRIGEDVAIRYCVMCLADGEKTPAVCLVEIKSPDKNVEAGYCRDCGQTMKNQGHTLKELPPEEQASRKQAVSQPGSHRGPAPKLTEAQRSEIVASSEHVKKLAARYGVSVAMIYKIRSKPREQTLATAIAEQGPAAIEEAIEVEWNPEPVEFTEYPFLQTKEEMPIEEAKRRFPVFNVPGYPWLPVPMQPQEPASPDNVIVFHISEEKADRIWNTSTLERKLTFARAELLERLTAL